MEILLLQKPNKSRKLPLKSFVHGLKRIKIVLLSAHPTKKILIEKTFAILLAALFLLNKKRKLCTLVSLPKKKWIIINDKKIFSDPNTLATSWLQTSIKALIFNYRTVKPFWNKQCLEVSNKLWLPTPRSKSSFVNEEEFKNRSWFAIRTLKNPDRSFAPGLRPDRAGAELFLSEMIGPNSSPLSTFKPVETKEEKEGIRSRKIRIYPTNQQKQIFKKWIGTTIFVYNKALKALKTEGETKYNFQSMRNRFVTYERRTGEINPEVKKWETGTPAKIRAGCLKDLETAFKAACTNLKRGNIRKFNLKYRDEKSFPSIVLPKTSLKILNGKLYIYKRQITDEIRVSKDKTFQNLVEFAYDCRLKYKFGKWYLIVPLKVELKLDVQGINKKDGICALDPGGRSFQVGYSETKVFKIQQDEVLLENLKMNLDFFQSLRSEKFISKSHYTRRIRRLYHRIDSLINDLHFKTIKYLKTHYTWILLPTFRTQQMVRKKGLHPKAKRNLMELQHYKFKERLKCSCLLDRFTDVSIIEEDFTTKTCTKCGNSKNEVGSKKIFKCSSCGFKCDRDVNAARNILLKNLPY